jgi:hypothetical protein
VKAQELFMKLINAYIDLKLGKHDYKTFASIRSFVYSMAQSLTNEEKGYFYDMTNDFDIMAEEFVDKGE